MCFRGKLRYGVNQREVRNRVLVNRLPDPGAATCCARCQKKVGAIFSTMGLRAIHMRESTAMRAIERMCMEVRGNIVRHVTVLSLNLMILLAELKFRNVTACYRRSIGKSLPPIYGYFHMATLSDGAKRFIVQALACFDSPQQVADAVKEEFGVEVHRAQVEQYDPTKASGAKLATKWRVLFNDTVSDSANKPPRFPLPARHSGCSLCNACLLR